MDERSFKQFTEYVVRIVEIMDTNIGKVRVWGEIMIQLNISGINPNQSWVI